VIRRSDAARRESQARTEADRRRELFESAERSFVSISETLFEAIQAVAPAVTASRGSGQGWTLGLNHAELKLSGIGHRSAWGQSTPAFDVIAVAELNLKIPPDYYEYEGRGHSLWFADVKVAGNYAWYETAFMISPLMGRQGRQDPFALDPGEEAARAIGRGMADLQVAWPFTPLIVGELDEWVDRWAGWFADAADGKLSHPGSLPERSPQGSWRST
jgi:eukaryotic-like serine/threonine-protein kinase